MRSSLAPPRTLFDPQERWGWVSQLCKEMAEEAVDAKFRLQKAEASHARDLVGAACALGTAGIATRAWELRARRPAGSRGVD